MASTKEIMFQNPETEMTDVLDTQDFDDHFEAKEDAPPLPTFDVKWTDLSHVGKSVILKTLTDHHRSFHKACEMLLLYRDDIEKWLRVYQNERDQERRWKLQLAWWEQQSHDSVEDYLQADGPVEMELLTHREMHKAAKFVGDFGYTSIASGIKALSHKKFAWPLQIDISTYVPFKIQDGNINNMDLDDHSRASDNYLDDDEDDRVRRNEGQRENDVEHKHEDDEEDEHEDKNEDKTDGEPKGDPELSNSQPVRALVSLSLTSPQIKVKNGIRLLTCILPRGTVVIGPRGKRQILNQAGEYRICPPPKQQTPIEAESQLDFVTDDLTLTSIIHEEVQNTAQASKANGDNCQLATNNMINIGGFVQGNENELASNINENITKVTSVNDQPIKHDGIADDESMRKQDKSFEDIMETTLNQPYNATTDGLHDFSAPAAEQMPEFSFFQDATATSEFPSPRLPTQITPLHVQEQPVKAKTNLELQTEKANEQHIKSRAQLQHDLINPPLSATEVQCTFGDQESEAFLHEVSSAAFAGDGPLQERHGIWERVSELQDDVYISLSPTRLIKDAPTVASTEFKLGLRETLPDGSRPKSIAVGPVERSWAPVVVDDPLDLAFMTIPLPANHAVISPTGYMMNFNTDHRGPIDGKAPAGEGGVYSFFLPEMAKRLPENFRPCLHDWVGFRIFLPQQIGLALNGKWLKRWAIPGMHQIAEIDGELDLLNAIGRYRIFNDMIPIGTPIRMGATGSGKRYAVIQEAKRTIAPYKEFLEREDEEEKAEDARRAEDQRLAQKRTQVRVQRQLQKEQNQKLAAEREQEQRAEIEESKRLETQPLGRGSRTRRPTARYLEMTSFTGDVNQLIDGKISNSVPVIDQEQDLQSDDDYIENESGANVHSDGGRTSSTRARQKKKKRNNNLHARRGLEPSAVVASGPSKREPQSAKPVQITKNNSVLTTAPKITSTESGEGSNSMANHLAQHLGAKRPASSMIAEEAVVEGENVEPPAKKGRGRPRKSNNALANPAPQPNTVSAHRHRFSSQAPVQKSMQNSVYQSPPKRGEGVRQPMRGPATQLIAPRPPLPQSYTGHLPGKILPMAMDGAIEKPKPAPKLTAPTITTKGYSSLLAEHSIQSQLSGMRLAEKMPSMPKYDLKSARKIAVPDEAPEAPSFSSSVPPKLASPMKATVAHQSYVPTKPASVGPGTFAPLPSKPPTTTSGSPLKNRTSPMRTYTRTPNVKPHNTILAPVASYTPSAMAMTQRFPAIQPATAYPVPAGNEQSALTTFPASFPAPGHARKLMPGFIPPVSQPNPMLSSTGPPLAFGFPFQPQTGSTLALGAPFPSQTGLNSVLGPPFQPRLGAQSSQAPQEANSETAPRTTAFTASQLPGNYPAQFRTKDGQIRYQSLSGKVFLCPITAIQCDQGAGMIDLDAATMALAKVTGYSNK